MRTNVFIVLFFLTANLMSAKEIKITRLFEDDSFAIEYYPEETEKLILYDSDGNRYRTVGFDGIGQLHFLKFLELHNMPIKNYLFLERLSNLEELHIICCSLDDIQPLLSLKLLRFLEVAAYIPQEIAKKIQENGLDFSQCKNLEHLEFISIAYPFEQAPPFKTAGTNMKIIWH